MKTVKTILDEKGKVVWTIRPEAKVYEALKLMAAKSIGALLVMEKNKVIGIFSERDYARKVVLKGKTALDTPVREIMTPHVLYISPETSIEECMTLMTEKRVRHLPVFGKKKLIGLVSIGDVVKSVISQQQLTIEQLNNYIQGKYL